MLKRYLFLLLLVVLYGGTKAQVNYTFSASSGTYTPLGAAGTNPTILPFTTGYPTLDEGFANAVPIGFNFVYNGVSYNTVNICTNGFLSFGSAILADANENFYLDSLAVGPSSQPSARPIIAPFWGDHDMQAATNISYSVSGTAPNRIFTVEWSNALWDYAATTASISFQAKLIETSNNIQFIYQQEAGTPSISARAAIGLTASGVGSGNFLSLSDVSSAPTVSSTVETTLFARPATGQVYTFSPLSCIPPLGLTISNQTATSATASWSAVTGATGYEYAVSTSATPPASGTAVTSTSVNLTALSAGVNYVFVRTNCGGTFSLWTTKAIIPCTTNISPANGATGVASPPTLSWNAVTGATGYSVMFSTDGVTYTNLGTLPAPTTTTPPITGTSANTTYWWYIRAVAGGDTASESCSTNATSFTTQGGPSNDSVCNAIALTLNGPSDCQNTASATIETNDPTVFSCSTPNNTVWYTYTPATTGNVVVKMKRSTGATTNLDAWVGFFTATGTCPTLTMTEEFSGTCNEADLTTLDSVSITSGVLTAGTTYYIMIDGFAGAVGEFCISLEGAPPPPPCTTLLLPANNATNVAVPPTLTWNSAVGANGYDVLLGTTNPPTAVLGNTVDTTASITGLAYSTTYYWTINPTNSGVSASCSNVYSFTTASGPLPPVNDTVCNAITLALNGPSDCQTTETATVGPNEPTMTCSTPNNTVWYKYTPTVTGPVKITMKRFAGATTNLRAWVSIFTANGGSCPAGLTLSIFTTNCQQADLTTLDSVKFNTDPLIAGTTYYIMVDGFSGAVGGFCINLADTGLVTTCSTIKLPLNNATNVSAPTTRIQWTAAPGADGYDIALGTVNPPTLIGNTTDTTLSINGLSFNTTYYWSVTPTYAGIPAAGCTSIVSFTTGSSPAPPANNECIGSIALAPFATVNGSTINATESLPASVCNGSTGDANDDVWYSITATNNGNATILVTPNFGFDAVVEAFTGNCTGLTSLACADNGAAGQAETLTLTGLTAGQVVYIRVFEFGSNGSEGLFTIYADGTALPIKLISFKGERIGSKNLLSWSTSSEQNNRGFELQRSADGDNFSTLTFVGSKAPNGNSSSTLNYQYADEKPLSGNSYYRLKQIDINGAITYSNIVLIKGTRSAVLTMSSVYPNPVSESLKVVLSAPASDKVVMVITDLAGRIVIQQPTKVVSGDNIYAIDVKQLPSGSYLIKALCADGCETAVSKFVKQ